MGRHRVPFSIRFYEVGPDGRAGMATVANLLQEAAGSHAATLGLSQTQLRRHNLGWVVLRLAWDVTRLPGQGEAVTVETWPSSTGRGLVNREYRMLDTDGGLLLAASSIWAAFDPVARRIAALPDSLIAKIPFEPEIATAPRPRVIPRLETVSRQAPVLARHGDLDLNGHVNNARIVGWLFEPGVPGSALLSLNVQFRQECEAGDEITALAEETAPGHLRHALIHSPSGTEIAHAESRWRI